MQKTKLLLNILAFFLCALPAIAVAQGGGNVTVRGIVTSADDKQPLIGVNVISGATSGVSTLADGSYSISVAAGSTLTFQYIGYKPATFTVPGGSASLTYNVSLESEAQALDDVVVIAYGVRKKGTIAGSVSTVKAEKVENTPTAAFDQAIQGQVPGLTVLSNSGEPSTSATMMIRGMNSINSGTSPLYILDGVAIASSDFNTINPADIESISVLKDASSTSIYGARAANGVIVITTKRGRMAERAKINYRMQLGFSQIAYGNWDLMNTSERIQYEKELGLTDGKNYNVLAKTDVNWLDEVFNDAALLQNYELSVSGATDKTNYYVSGGYYNQEGIAVGSAFERFSLRANVEQQAAKWLKLGTNTMMNYQTIEKADDGEYTLTTPISAARFMLPYWNPHRADGSLASVNDGSWKGEGQNPLEWLKNNPVDYKKYKIISTVFAEATPIEGLTLRSQFGVDYSHSTGRGISYPSYAPNLGSGTVQRNSSDGMSLSVTNTITYRFDIDNKHMFTFLAGQEGLDYRYEAFSLQTKDQNNDKLVNISSSPRATRWNDTTDDNYAYLSFFGRAEYSYSDRYYADFSLRTDGSSRFGASNRWAGFWSVGFMWNLRNEKFMENSRRWLTLAQIAVSTGTSGNSEIPNYEHLALVTGGQNYFGNAGIAPTQPGNEELSWEKLWTTNVALHLGFWNRLNLDVELYNKKTTDMLMAFPTAPSLGYSSYYANVGDMSNKGIEVDLNFTPIRSKNVQWDINVNLTHLKNKIISLPPERRTKEVEGYYGYAGSSFFYGQGLPLYTFYMKKYAGVSEDGRSMWYKDVTDKDGKPTGERTTTTAYSEGSDYLCGNAIPDLYGGFGTSVSFFGFDFGINFNYQIGGKIYDSGYAAAMSTPTSTGSIGVNWHKDILNAWTPENPNSNIPRMQYGDSNTTDTSDRFLIDASYLTLQNINFGYTLPSKFTQKFGVGKMRIYLACENVFYWSKRKGLDPRYADNTDNQGVLGTSNYATYSPIRTISGGINIQF